MKTITMILSLFIAGSTAFADSAEYTADQENQKVILTTIQPGQKLLLDTQFILLVNNSLDIIVDDQLVYKLSLEGSNSYNRGFLRNTKNNLTNKMTELSTSCINLPIHIVGEVKSWRTSILSETYTLVINPQSVTAVCDQ